MQPHIDIDGPDALYLLPWAKRLLGQLRDKFPLGGKRRYPLPDGSEVTIWWNPGSARVRLTSASGSRMFTINTWALFGFPYTNYLFKKDSVLVSPMSPADVTDLQSAATEFYQRYVMGAIKRTKPPAFVSTAVTIAYPLVTRPAYFNPETGEFRIDNARLASVYDDAQMAFLKPFEDNFAAISIAETGVPTINNDTILVNIGSLAPLWGGESAFFSETAPIAWAYPITTYTPDGGTVHSNGGYARVATIMVPNSATPSQTGINPGTLQTAEVTVDCPLVAHNGTFSWGSQYLQLGAYSGGDAAGSLFLRGATIDTQTFTATDISGAIVSRFLLGKALNNDNPGQIDVYANGRIVAEGTEIYAGVPGIHNLGDTPVIANDTSFTQWVVSFGGLAFSGTISRSVYDPTRVRKEFLSFPPVPATDSAIGGLFDVDKGKYAYLRANIPAGFNTARAVFLSDPSTTNRDALRATYTVLFNTGIHESWLDFFRPGFMDGPIKETKR